MDEITLTERDHDCVFTLTVSSDDDVVARVLDEYGDDITRDEFGNPGPVVLSRNSDGTYSGVVGVCDQDAGEKITFVVAKVADPAQMQSCIHVLDHDCPRCEEVLAEMAVPAAARSTTPPPVPTSPEPAPTPIPRPRAKAKAKVKAKAKRPTKAKTKPKAKAKLQRKKPVKKSKKAKPAAKPKRRAPAARKKAKPAKKRPAANKKKKR